ncbi:class I SAM-dependent methyltransferase [[Eubacterium] cellulosolvens]
MISVEKDTKKIRQRLMVNNLYFNNTADFLLTNISGSRVLSVGCGSGDIEKIIKFNGSKEIMGLEISKSENPKIPIKLYDGEEFPFENNSFDTVLFVYCLHHTKSLEEIRRLMEEAARVSKKEILILDHVYSNILERFGLILFDYCWNKIFYLKLKMPITFNYLKEREWQKLFDDMRLKVVEKENPFRSSIFFKLTN